VSGRPLLSQEPGRGSCAVGAPTRATQLGMLFNSTWPSNFRASLPYRFRRGPPAHRRGPPAHRASLPYRCHFSCWNRQGSSKCGPSNCSLLPPQGLRTPGPTRFRRTPPAHRTSLPHRPRQQLRRHIDVVTQVVLFHHSQHLTTPSFLGERRNFPWQS
jgi:hypothetical protein